MCQFDWVTDCSRIWCNIILGVFGWDPYLGQYTELSPSMGWPRSISWRPELDKKADPNPSKRGSFLPNGFLTVILAFFHFQNQTETLALAESWVCWVLNPWTHTISPLETPARRLTLQILSLARFHNYVSAFLTINLYPSLFCFSGGSSLIYYVEEPSAARSSHPKWTPDQAWVPDRTKSWFQNLDLVCTHPSIVYASIHLASIYWT